LNGLGGGGLLFLVRLRGLWHGRWLAHDSFQGLGLGFHADVPVALTISVPQNSQRDFLCRFFSPCTVLCRAARRDRGLFINIAYRCAIVDKVGLYQSGFQPF
jgi:hypothetical protein